MPFSSPRRRPSPLEFVADGGTVRARRGETLVWENVHDRQGRFRGSSAFRLQGPVSIGESVYYAVGASLFEVSAGTGTVLHRTSLPDAVSRLEADGDAVAVTVASSSTDLAWTRTYRVGPGAPGVPFYFSGSLLAARMTALDAQTVLRDIVDADPSRPAIGAGDDWWREPQFEPHLERAVSELARLAEQDATNPFYRYWRGEYLRELGREEEAMAAFRSTLAADPGSDYELLALALRLDEAAPELGEEAFRRGLTFLLHHGYEPEMMGPVISILVYYGSPRRERTAVAPDLARLRVLGERMWDLAPHAEFVTTMFHGIAQAHGRAGQADQEALWQARSQAAMPYRIFGYVGSSVDWLGAALNGLLASLLALLGCLVVKCLRAVPGRPRRSWNPLRYWTRGETAGFLAVMILVLVAGHKSVQGIAAVGKAAAMPIGGMSGNFGHPAGVTWLARLAGTPGGDFIHALALHKAGDLAAAAAIYARLDDARAKNNLGAVKQALGQDAEARRLFEEARAADPALGEAAFNLGAAGAGPRVERAREYGLPGPLLAMPTVAMWTEALGSGWAPWRILDVFGVFEMFGTVYQLGSADGPAVLRAAFLEPRHFVGALYLLLLVAAVAALVSSPITPPRSWATVTGWALGFAVPGPARRLGALGPLVLAAAVFSYLVHHSLATSGGHASNPIEAIALPSLDRAYGIGALVYTPVERAVRGTESLWWILWLANLVGLGLLEWRRPDPLGPRARG